MQGSANFPFFFPISGRRPENRVLAGGQGRNASSLSSIKKSNSEVPEEGVWGKKIAWGGVGGQ